MDIFYPKYYDSFACIADKCPDSCCKEWSVDVDAASATFYRNLTGPLGDRLREVLQDTADGTILTIENGRCPMWRRDGLCRIQAELGHDALCRVCRTFPRLRHDYGTFAELGLELSCPEAARLIFAEADQEWICSVSDGDEAPEYDVWTMDVLRRSRTTFLSFLDATDLPFPRILSALLLYAYDVQEELDGGEPAVFAPGDTLVGIAPSCDYTALQDFFLSLEILTPQWKTRLEACPVTPRWSRAHRALLRYFLSRYWLQAVSDYDIVCQAKFAIASCLLIGCLGGDLTETAQLFSKEIENDVDNVEAILNGAYTHPALTDAAILGLLLED